MKNKKIQTVSDFVNTIKNIGKKNIFYRGHSDLDYDLIPSIYRADDLGKLLYIDNEDKMFREVISNSPNEFKGRNTLECLTLMQHYGLPTRILDLTENPLIALYFACQTSKSKEGMTKDGEVIIFEVDDENIAHYNSDKVTILSNITKCNSKITYDTYLTKIINDYRKRIEKYSNREVYITSKDGEYEVYKILVNNFSFLKKEDIKFLEWETFNLAVNNSFFKLKEKLNISTLTNNQNLIAETIIYQRLLEVLNEYELEYINRFCNTQILKLYNNIKEDKHYFEPRILPKDLSRNLIIKPKLDNPRIIRQHGSFIIFGLKEEAKNKEIPPLDKNWIRDRIVIDESSKAKILSELDTLRINELTLFPEIDKVCNYIKNNLYHGMFK